MKTSAYLKSWIALLAALGCAHFVHSQGIVTFDNWAPYSFTQYYTESGVLLQVLSANGNAPQSVMGRYPGGPGTADPTPFMDWVEDHGTNSGYIAISLLSGGTFGLVSVDLGQITAATNVLFVGYFADGSSATNSYYFPTPIPSQMPTFTFSPNFSQGLTHVDVFAVSYAMDNLVVTVPEPKKNYLLLVFGFLAFANRYRMLRKFAQRG